MNQWLCAMGGWFSINTSKIKDKFGIKIFELCTNDGFVLKTKIYSDEKFQDPQCYCQYTRMGSNNNEILDRLSIVDEYVQIAIKNLQLLK